MGWISVTEAAHHAGVGTDTIRRWADAGRVQAIRTVGGHRRVDVESLTSVLRHGRMEARSISPIEAVDQFVADGEGWFSWEPPATWTIDRTDEFLRAVEEAELALRRLRESAAGHLDRIGG